MRILYGLSGDGLGHAMRSLVVAYELAARGHDVTLACSSGRAHRYLASRWQHRLVRIPGLHTRIEDGSVKPVDTIVSNLAQMVLSPLSQVLPALWIVKPDVVISDFDPWTTRYAHTFGIPLIALDNIHFLTRCQHPSDVLDKHRDAAAMMHLSVENMVPGATRYMVTTFALASVTEPRTSLHLPIFRPEVTAYARNPWGTLTGDHVVVYFNDKADHTSILRELQRLAYVEFHLYGGPYGEGWQDNVLSIPYSDGLLRDMWSAQAVIGGGGFTFLTESIALGKPALAVPFAGQFEQILNGEYLERLGYGQWAPELTADRVAGFLGRVPEYRESLRGFAHDGNEELYDYLDQNLRNAHRDRAA